MNSTVKLLLIVLVAATGLLSTGVADGASSPALVTGRASSVRSASAVLHGTINPNGEATHYRFEWGLTTSYGAASPLRSAGSASAVSSVDATISALLPGTVYHYRVVASNNSGATSGADRAFKTKGHPPPGASTGSVTQIGLRAATVSGVVDPNGEATTYLFQYGLTSAYGSQTFGVTLAAGGGPMTVSQQLQGLAPGTAFHYRIVALHGGITSYGADATFVTLPLRRRLARLRAKTLPHRERGRSYLFKTTGRLIGASSLLASARCSGSVSVAFLRHRHPVAVRLVPLQPDCTFMSQTRLRNLPRRLKRRNRVGLRVEVRFRGNPYVASARARAEEIVIGRK
jgi:hypothetical protein